MACRAYVFVSRPGDVYRVGRTLRSLKDAGIEAEAGGTPTRERWREMLATTEPVLLLRAGAWLCAPGSLRLPDPSATGKPTCALGCVRLPPEADASIHEDSERWRRLFARTGGDFARGVALGADLPDWISVYLDSAAVRLARDLATPDLASVLALAGGSWRVVHYPPLDVFDDTSTRVCQVITSLHRGGAERLTLDLLEVLPELGIPSRLVTLGCPFRSCFPTPLDALELGGAPGTAADRIERLRRYASRFGADLLHAHLLDAEQLRALGGTSIPVLTTLHNARPGWPRGFDTITTADVACVASCSMAVERDACEARVAPPVRTTWNGIRTEFFRRTPERALAGRRQREAWELPANAVVLLSLANFRPQKGLDRLPEILDACRKRFDSADPGQRPVALVLAGEPARNGGLDDELETRLRAELAPRESLGPVIWTGSVVDVTTIACAADVLVSPARHEGLSLAQLEALALGCPVVATAVGGAEEVSRHHPRLHLVPPDAPAEAFAEAIGAALRGETHRPPEVPPCHPSARSDPPVPLDVPDSGDPRLESFSTARMAARYAWLYRRALARAPGGVRRPGRGVWLVTNHLATGGAQTSARRLLPALKAAGHPVRAALVQEYPQHPSRGRLELEQAGIPVTVVPPPETTPPLRAVERLLEDIDLDPPAAVFFWNLIPVYKILIADGLMDIPVFDVSPGAMMFESLERYFRRPEPGLPYLSAPDYGARLAGCVVKYAEEAPRAAEILKTPVHVIPNGVDPDAFPVANLHEGNRAPRSRLLLGTVARLHPHKRLEDLVEALKLAGDRLPPWRLRIAGGTERGFEDYAARLRSQTEGLPIDWLGDVPDVREEIRDWDLFVSISEPSGCPNAILEAMATGLPVIATAVGGAREQIVHDESGWLVPPRDSDALTAALCRAAPDEAARRRVGAAARLRVRSHFGLERMAEAYGRLLQQVRSTAPA